MIYRLAHRTLYRYAEPASFARHLLHLLPRARPGQRVIAASLDIAPQPEHRFDETDYFGNTLTTIALIAPHETLEIVLRAEIDLVPAIDLPIPAQSCDAIRASAPGRPDLAEFLLPTRLTAPDAAIEAFARSAAGDYTDSLAVGLGLMRAIFASFTYRPGSTSIATTARTALSRREGVCQDYAHVMLAALRAIGLPCRYVSGYLRSGSDDGDALPRGAEQSHAWVSLWTGDESGWVDLDPTNGLLVEANHATLAWGRDFEDVSPVRGVIRGGGRHTPLVEVTMTPVAPRPDAAPGGAPPATDGSSGTPGG